MAEEPRKKIAKLDQDSEDFTSSFAAPWHHSDVVLVIEGHKFHVHKCILSMNSPVFERMFSPDSRFEETSAAEIPLPGKKKQEFEVLLKLTYFNDKDLITGDSVEFLLKLADEYQMEKHTKCCADFMNSTATRDNSFYYYQLADQYAIRDRVNNCFEEVTKQEITKIQGSQYFDKLSYHGKFLIFLEKSKELELENDKYYEIIREYYDTCYELVGIVYNEAASHTTLAECTHTSHDISDVQGFMISCPECVLQLDKKVWQKCRTDVLQMVKEYVKRLLKLEEKVPDN